MNEIMGTEKKFVVRCIDCKKERESIPSESEKWEFLFDYDDFENPELRIFFYRCFDCSVKKWEREERENKEKTELGWVEEVGEIERRYARVSYDDVDTNLEKTGVVKIYLPMEKSEGYDYEKIYAIPLSVRLLDGRLVEVLVRVSRYEAIKKNLWRREFLQKTMNKKEGFECCFDLYELKHKWIVVKNYWKGKYGVMIRPCAFSLWLRKFWKRKERQEKKKREVENMVQIQILVGDNDFRKINDQQEIAKTIQEIMEKKMWNKIIIMGHTQRGFGKIKEVKN